tara:strand:+ start:645 stop:935 length:291 start_codon:yes stop_codon:yes gene_type:complete
MKSANITAKQNRLVVIPTIECVVKITIRNHVKSNFISADLYCLDITPRKILTNIHVFIDINIGLKGLILFSISSKPSSMISLLTGSIVSFGSQSIE